ncbi:uncharacterized protein LOC143450418 [Clavelina lepadiformis]|uniref:uncharacterized protein LOC143450418 n=1 Tax=Clavelina lepadiformis TaxID=159417 RepID=UPI004041BEA4
MKVICAGLSKTGTKSLKAALEELGYNVYDFVENFQFLAHEWTKILEEGGTTEDFRRMFENVDAVTDSPSCYFWDEIHKAFPEAKIIFTMREDEDTWAKSMWGQVQASNNPLLLFLFKFSPTFQRMQKWRDIFLTAMYGTCIKEHFFRPADFNMLLAKMTYRRHNAHVLQNAPKDKLLVYSVKDGWEPLCKFLEVDIPSTPFPRKNVRATLVKEFLEEHPIVSKGKREIMISFTVSAILLSYGVFRFYKSSPLTWMKEIPSYISRVWN